MSFGTLPGAMGSHGVFSLRGDFNENTDLYSAPYLRTDAPAVLRKKPRAAGK